LDCATSFLLRVLLVLLKEEAFVKPKEKK
jgi:hypothetical protein